MATRMKSLARLHVWWPYLDTDIEFHVKSYVSCTETAKDPTKIPLHQWKRLHINFAGSYCNKMWMVLNDAYSKWPEAHAMESTTMEAIIKHLQQIFATHGIPYQIVLDSGPQFTAETSFVYLMEFSSVSSSLQ